MKETINNDTNPDTCPGCGRNVHECQCDMAKTKEI